MLWAALLPDLDPSSSSPSIDVLNGTATWALQYTPRVAVVEASAVALELSASTRLFGGKRLLVERIRNEAAELGLKVPSWAPTSLAALALARSGETNGFGRPLDQVLDALPFVTLTAANVHEATLSRLGCRTLGDVRALPRGGLSRRFDAQLLAALDQARQAGYRDRLALTQSPLWQDLRQQPGYTELLERIATAIATERERAREVPGLAELLAEGVH